MSSDLAKDAGLAEKQVALTSALGRAITRWAAVEMALVEIFISATGMQKDMAVAVLRPVKTFRLLMDMCNAAVRIRLADNPCLRHWNSLVDYANELSGDRNYMAHNAMVFHSPGDPQKVDVGLVEPKIGPDILAALAYESVDANSFERSLSAEEILELLEDFHELVEALFSFRKAWETGTTSQDKYLKPIERRRPPRNKRLEAARQARAAQPQS